MEALVPVVGAAGVVENAVAAVVVACGAVAGAAAVEVVAAARPGTPSSRFLF